MYIRYVATAATCSATQEDTKNLKQLFVAVPATLFILGSGLANAGETINEAGAIVCVNDTSKELGPDKGHKLVDLAQRCVLIPDDAAVPKFTQDCVGHYEYMPDGSWRVPGPAPTSTKGETRHP